MYGDTMDILNDENSVLDLLHTSKDVQRNDPRKLYAIRKHSSVSIALENIEGGINTLVLFIYMLLLLLL